MRKLLPLIFASFMMASHAGATNFFTVDTHEDTTQRLIGENFDLTQRANAGSVDIPRMREGHLGASFFSIWMPGTVTGAKAVADAEHQIAAVKLQVQKHPDDLALATSVAQIESARKDGKIAVLMGMEGGHMINNNLDNLRRFAKEGVRYMTLTHSKNTDWADSSTDKPAHNGLTPFGKKVVQEMNKLGLMVDISHVSDKTFYDALAISKAPMIASHSSARVLCKSPRNMTNKMIKDLAAKGGVIQVNFNTPFISEKFRLAAESKEVKERVAALRKQCGSNESCSIINGQKLSRQLVAEKKLPKVDWEEILDHIDHIVALVGVDHVGIGSDFDGADMPFGMEDASRLPQISNGLLARGYEKEDVAKIMGGNTLRVMREVEKAAKA